MKTHFDCQVNSKKQNIGDDVGKPEKYTVGFPKLIIFLIVCCKTLCCTLFAKLLSTENPVLTQRISLVLQGYLKKNIRK